HGSFLQNMPQETLPISPEQRVLTLEDELPSTDYEKLWEANPLLRSCLFFAGANTGGTTSDDDGTMTALEASQLNLWGTKLVVLSACDSGVGDVKNGDGVYGLRRALVLAGSEAQVMSLWPVSDQGTKELMTNFYRRLKAGEGRSQALHNTQLEMLKSKRWKHPFYWAAFIQSGAWTNLEGK
ncbi:MAG TPA: CHAT domain-containing protein, partial [Acidobacteriota bacterium]|nr:CHAT domain-containing protein [Acidobacteriota bacterium]